MSRDYKPRDQDKKIGLRRQKYGKQQPKIALWKWMLIVAITISFVVFLVYLKTVSIKPINIKQSSQTIENKVTAEHEKNPEVKTSFEIGGFSAHSDNEQDWFIESDETRPVIRIRKDVRCQWKDKHGNRYHLADKPHKFYDYNF